MGAEALSRLGLAPDDLRRSTLAIRNPHHGGDILLRTSLIPSLIEVAQRNLNADAPVPVRLFQVNRVYWPAGRHVTAPRHPGEDRLPEEPLVLQIALAGWTAAGLDGVPADLLELKGVLGQIGALTRQELRLVPADTEIYLGRGQQWRVEDAEGRILGSAGRLAAAVASSFALDHPLALAEIGLDRLTPATEPVVFSPFSRFPAVKRDLSLLVPDDVAFGTVCATVTERAGPHLESVELFDIYRGNEIGIGRAALGIRLKFRSRKGNLKGETVDRSVADIVAALDREHGIRLRD
jgi:phenylalanyl-tRNA synthetase beta chain